MTILTIYEAEPWYTQLFWPVLKDITDVEPGIEEPEKGINKPGKRLGGAKASETDHEEEEQQPEELQILREVLKEVAVQAGINF